MAKYVITGGAGFIGSNTAQELVRRRHQVKIIDNFSTGDVKNIKNILNRISLVKGDIGDKKLMMTELKDADFVIHLAALRSVPGSILAPAKYNKTNIDGTLNILSAAAENKVKKLVFASSSSVYGQESRLPMRESDRPKPNSPYALTKLAGEHYCEIFSKHFQLPTAVLRYFNVFGPGQSLDNDYAVLIPKSIDCFKRDGVLPIYGTGKQSRDYIFINDVVTANLRAATSPTTGVYNVGSAEKYTVLEVIKVLSAAFGRKIQLDFQPERPGDIKRTLADLTKIQKDLGYRPETDFAVGIKRTIEKDGNDQPS